MKSSVPAGAGRSQGAARGTPGLPGGRETAVTASGEREKVTCAAMGGKNKRGNQQGPASPTLPPAVLQRCPQVVALIRLPCKASQPLPPLDHLLPFALLLVQERLRHHTTETAALHSKALPSTALPWHTLTASLQLLICHLAAPRATTSSAGPSCGSGTVGTELQSIPSAQQEPSGSCREPSHALPFTSPAPSAPRGCSRGGTRWGFTGPCPSLSIGDLRRVCEGVQRRLSTSSLGSDTSEEEKASAGTEHTQLFLHPTESCANELLPSPCPGQAAACLASARETLQRERLSSAGPPDHSSCCANFAH